MLDWNESQIETLKIIWAHGNSASQIARVIGNGATRSSIIGKVHRLKLPSHGSNAPVQPKVSKAVRVAKLTGGNGSAGKHRGLVDAARRARNGNAGQPKAAAIQHRITMGEIKPPKALSVVELPATRLKLTDLDTHDCRWIDGDPLGEHSFCGQPVKEGTSWCPTHHARVFLRR